MDYNQQPEQEPGSNNCAELTMREFVITVIVGSAIGGLIANLLVHLVT